MNIGRTKIEFLQGKWIQVEPKLNFYKENVQGKWIQAEPKLKFQRKNAIQAEPKLNFYRENGYKMNQNWNSVGKWILAEPKLALRFVSDKMVLKVKFYIIEYMKCV